MSRLFKVLSVALAGIAIPGCEVATEPEVHLLASQFVPNLASGCYAVDFVWTASPTSDVRFSGPLTGDLEGTMASDFDPNSLKFAGSTLATSFFNYWTVTGGVLPEPVSFVTASRAINHLGDRPGSPAEVVEAADRHHATSGVQRANLTASIKVDFSVPPGHLVANFHGVICP
jgi:hypothetical protein